MKINLLFLFIIGSSLFSGMVSAQCNFSQNEFNNASEQNSKRLNPEILSEIETNDQVGESFLIYASLQNIDEAKFLKLTIKASLSAVETLGNLYKGENVQLELNNKEVIRLSIFNISRNFDNEMASIDLSLLLGEARIETLKTNKVELLQLPWSKGGKSYDITSESYFITNLPCIN